MGFSAQEFEEVISSGRFEELGILYNIMGASTLNKFLGEYQGITIHVPMEKSIRSKVAPKRIYKDYINGMDYHSLAKKYGYTERHIQSILANMRKTIHK